jgi:potassium efflux system protein
MTLALPRPFLPTRRRCAKRLCYTLLALWLCLPPALAQRDVAALPEVPTAERLEERIKSLQGTGAEDPQSQRLLELYRLALERLIAAETHRQAAAEYRQAAADAPAVTRRLQQQAAAVEPPSAVDESKLADADLATLEQTLTAEQADRAALQSQFSELEQQLRTLQARPTAAREELAQARLRLEALELELLTPPPPGEDERVREARQAALLAQRLALERQIAMLEQELLSLDARRALLTARHELTDRRLERQTQWIQQLKALANERSRQEAAQVAEAAEQALREPEGVTPLVQEVAARNAALSGDLAALVAQLEDANRREQQIQQQLDLLRTRLNRAQQQLEIAGLDAALAELLRQERRSLPAPERFTRSVEQRQGLLSATRLKQFQLEQEVAAAPDIEQRVAKLLSRRLPELDAADVPQTAAQLRQLLSDRNALQQQLVINYGRFVDQLSELNRNEQQLVAQVALYRELLDESLFWIAGAPPVSLQWFGQIGGSLLWLVSPAHWSASATALIEGALERPATSIGVLVLALLLIRGRRQLRQQLDQIAAEVNTPTDRFPLTLQALLDTLLLALTWPLLVGAAGWLTAQGADGQPFAYAAGRALQAVAVVGVSIEAFRQLCRDRGVAQVHFEWRERSRFVLRRNLAWLLAVSLPLTFLISLTERQSEELFRHGLGRLAFVLASVAISIFAWRVLQPRFRLVPGLRRERRRGWWKLRRTLRPLAVGAPLALAGLALYGYYYTALQLESRLFSTGWLLIAAGILANLGLRWMRLARRRLAQRIADRAEAGGRNRRGEADLEGLTSQARSLLRIGLGLALLAGLWLIWSDLLPALNILENVVLWQQVAEDGERIRAVTLADFAFALLVVALTLIAARNLPGLLEITLLSRLEVDPGNRYAITSLSRYLIIAVGLLVGINLLGFTWSRAQWLVAALGVGLGFGLQEIFANFVSGLILLFERPIRVGDTVSIGELSGRVSRIRIRATTITDWDRREIIIPNKSFITDQLVNWTLSDQVTRVVIRLNVGRGCSPDEIQAMLLEAAAENPRVMRDPEPFAYFLGFGDGLLQFELHIFVPALEDRLLTKHQVQTQIHRRLAEMGVEIPYPPRELFIRELDADIERRPRDIDSDGGRP